MNIDPEDVELREVVRQTIEIVEQNAKDNAYLRGAFEQMDKRLDNLIESVNQRFEDLTQMFNQRSAQVDERFAQVDGRLEIIEARIFEVVSQLNSQLRWMIALMAPLYLALIALIVKVFLGIGHLF